MCFSHLLTQHQYVGSNKKLFLFVMCYFSLFSFAFAFSPFDLSQEIQRLSHGAAAASSSVPVEEEEDDEFDM